jgi:hypothetical protein
MMSCDGSQGAHFPSGRAGPDTGQAKFLERILVMILEVFRLEVAGFGFGDM